MTGGAVPSIQRARLHVPCGPLATTLAGRFVGALAAHTTLGIDRVGEACAITEALSDRCAELLANGMLDLAVSVSTDAIELSAGPYSAGTGGRILRADASYGPHGGTIRGLASAVDVRVGRDRRERVVIAVR